MLLSLGFIFVSLINPDEALKKADTFRSPPGGFVTTVQVKESNGRTSDFEVFIEGNEKSLIVTKSPARDVGRNMLMLDRDMWMFMPSINRAVRIALKQKLTGQVAQGDISRMRWFGDYKAEVAPAKPEPITTQGIALNLSAQKENLTYDRIMLWVDSKDFRPLQAIFQTSQGKALKSATYEDYGPMAGGQRPRKIVIKDALKPSEVSEILIKSMTETKFPQGFFSESNLPKPKAP